MLNVKCWRMEVDNYLPRYLPTTYYLLSWSKRREELSVLSSGAVQVMFIYTPSFLIPSLSSQLTFAFVHLTNLKSPPRLTIHLGQVKIRETGVIERSTWDKLGMCLAGTFWMYRFEVNILKWCVDSIDTVKETFNQGSRWMLGIHVIYLINSRIKVTSSTKVPDEHSNRARDVLKLWQSRFQYQHIIYSTNSCKSDFQCKGFKWTFNWWIYLRDPVEVTFNISVPDDEHSNRECFW